MSRNCSLHPYKCLILSIIKNDLAWELTETIDDLIIYQLINKQIH